MYDVAKYELGPPKLSELSQVKHESMKGFQSLINFTWCKRSVRDLLSNSFVAIDVMMWFFIGEIIGKGSLVGYDIPGTMVDDGEHHHSPDHNLITRIINTYGWYNYLF